MKTKRLEAKPEAHLNRPAATFSPTDAEKGSDVAVEPYINKREVAQRMGRTTRCIDNMMRRGVIPYYKFDARTAFRWSEIQNHLAQTCRTLRSASASRTCQGGNAER